MTKWGKFNRRYEALLVEASNKAIRLAGEKLAMAAREIKGRQLSGKPMDHKSCFVFLQALVKDQLLAGEIQSSGALGFLDQDFIDKLPSLYSEGQTINPNDWWAEEINIDVCALVLKDLQRVYRKLLEDSADAANSIPGHILRQIVSDVYV